MTAQDVNLPEPDFYVATEPGRHGLRRCFKTLAQVRQNGNQEEFEGAVRMETLRKAVQDDRAARGEVVAWMLETTAGKVFRTKDDPTTDDWIPVYISPPSTAAIRREALQQAEAIAQKYLIPGHVLTGNFVGIIEEIRALAEGEPT